MAGWSLRRICGVGSNAPLFPVLRWRDWVFYPIYGCSDALVGASDLETAVRQSGAPWGCTGPAGGERRGWQRRRSAGGAGLAPQ